MRRVIATVLALLLTGLAGTVAAKSEKPEKGFEADAYASAVARYGAGDATVDVKWLRQQNLLNFHYMVPTWDEARKAFDSLQDDPANALERAKAWLAIDPLSIDANFVAEVALNRLKRSDEAQRHHAAIVTLLRAVTGGTDGQAQDKAWVAMSVGEEYSVLRLLGFQPNGQALVSKDGHSFDVMTVRQRDTDKDVKIWFNIDAFFGKEFGDLLD